jgi:16S rRNA (cytidine1402-2'-O)-methyltransferase
MTAKISSGTLYLLPTGLGDSALDSVLPAGSREVAHRLTHFIAENPKTARAFLKLVEYPRPINTATINELNKDTPAAAIPALLAPLQAGIDVALVSEAGCPAVADPGALLVRSAHAAGVRVVPLIGPSSILLALMASGLNGQNFAFNGYLPIEKTRRAWHVRDLEQRSRRDDATQIFIETPYRNDAMLQAVLAECSPQTLLCIATDITQPGEQIMTRSVADWRKNVPELDKRPSVFLLYCPKGSRRAS